MLSIPRQPIESDDGPLTASEVAQLNADRLVLSACNSTAGDRPGAEALRQAMLAYLNDAFTPLRLSGVLGPVGANRRGCRTLIIFDVAMQQSSD